MSKSKTEIKDREYFKYIHFLYEIVNILKNVEEIKLFLKDILTSSELRMIKRRWHIASLLRKGMSIREIALATKTSTQTVSRMKQILEEGRGGLALALERMEKELSKQQEEFREKHKSKGGSKFVKGWFS